MPDEVIKVMIARGRRVRCLWVYAPETEPCSATLAILWELQRKVRQFHQSKETFWLHNGSIINRDLIEFDNWRTPVPLPWWEVHTRKLLSFYQISVVLQKVLIANLWELRRKLRWIQLPTEILSLCKTHQLKPGWAQQIEDWQRPGSCNQMVQLGLYIVSANTKFIVSLCIFVYIHIIWKLEVYIQCLWTAVLGQAN